MGVLLLTLVATMTLFVAEPDRAHAQVLPSAIATLDTLLVVGGPSNGVVTALAQDDADGGGFQSDEKDYTVKDRFQ